jgi:hypothetical protein
MQQTTTPFSLSDKLQYVFCFASFFGLLLKIPHPRLLRNHPLSNGDGVEISNYLLLDRDMRVVFLWEIFKIKAV